MGHGKDRSARTRCHDRCSTKLASHCRGGCLCCYTGDLEGQFELEDEISKVANVLMGINGNFRLI